MRNKYIGLSFYFTYTGFVQTSRSKIKDVFQTFSKTIISFSRLKVIK